VGLAGITITYPVTLVLIAVALVVGVGGATKFSISLGQGKKEDASLYQGNALMLSVVFGLLFMLVGNILIKPLLKLLGASAQVLPYASDYLSIILYGAVFQSVAMCGNNFSRAQGNPKNAMISMIIGAVFNIVFDYILIIRLGMGMKGAALATIGGQLLSAIWQLAYLFSNRSMIKLNFFDLMPLYDKCIQIIKTGVPAFMMQIANSLFNVVINGTLASQGGDIAVSTVGIITSFQTILLMPIIGISQGQQPLISYNYGAEKIERVKATLKYALIGASIIAMVGFIVLELFPEFIITMFNKESEVIALGSHALRIWFLCLPLLGAQMMCANFFQAVGRVKQASFLNLIRQVILLIPLILLFAQLFGLYGIFWAVPCADISAFSITMYAIYQEFKIIQ
ncbi:MAG: MATE family efflux transporter, partial [Erysipelotrichia bacterium]|nr:MATE family efflux transporter [Erysipelotrichia bacterium]